MFKPIIADYCIFNFMGLVEIVERYLRTVKYLYIGIIGAPSLLFAFETVVCCVTQ